MELIKIIVILLTLTSDVISHRNQSISSPNPMSLRLPPHHTAMETDFEVLYYLPQQNSIQYNVIIHLEYLPGDSVLPPESNPVDKSKRLASLPVPLGLSRGAVVFQCGIIKHAGPHRAYLTVNGVRKFESEIIQVRWPHMVITAPTKMTTNHADVAVTISFTRSLCLTFTKKSSYFFGAARSIKKKADFRTTLDLVECSRSVVNSQEQDCQMPTLPKSGDLKDQIEQGNGRNRVWYSHPIDDLFGRSSFSVTLNCSVWGQSGTFRLFLATNLSHSAVISRSEAIQIEPNSDFSIQSLESQFVFPCLNQDIKPLEVRRPQCDGLNDRIRVYGQGKKLYF